MLKRVQAVNWAKNGHKVYLQYYTDMVKIIEGKKTVPMMGHFILLTSSLILLQIAYIRACSKAKIIVYDIYYFHIYTYFT